MAFKRVRFAVDAPRDDDSAVSGIAKKAKRRKTLLPGPEDDDEQLEGELTEGYRGLADVEDLLWDAEAEKGPIKATDPERAAANRATHRKQILRMACTEGGGLQEDIAAAEAEYEAAQNRHWQDSGVPLEPFSLKSEREAGYFDEDGNYVAYRDAEAEDAWLRSLPRGTGPDTGVEEEEDEVEDAVGKSAGAAGMEADSLDASTLRGYKEGVVELLHVGETVFGALRRLGGLQASPHDLHRQPARGTVKSAAGGAAGGAAGDKLTVPRRGRTVPAEHREAFERLTEWSSVLLEHGDYEVHSASREALQGDLRAHASGIPASSQPPPAPSRHPQPPAAAAAAATTAAAPPVGLDPQGWCAFAARIKVPARSSAASGQAAEHSAAEQAVDGGNTSAEGQSAEADVAALAAAPVDPEEDIFGGVGAGGNAMTWQGSAELAPSSVAAAPCPPEVSAASDLAGAATDAIPGPLDEALHEWAAADATDQDGGELEAGQATTASMQGVCAGMQANSSAPAAAEREAAVSSVSVSSASEDTSMAYAEAPGATSEDNAAEAAPPMSGFEYDSASGFFYNSELGAYFDPKRQLFGDAASGHWYHLSNGRYMLVH